MKWLLILVVYQAPPDAVDWNGPWTLGMSQVLKSEFESEEQCQAFAKLAIKKIHEGMLAPIRHKCVAFEASLPVNAPR